MPDIDSGDAVQDEPTTETTEDTSPAPAGEDPSADTAPDPQESEDPDTPEGDAGDEDDVDVDDDFEPEVAKRKTAKDFIIERKNRKIKQLKKESDDDGDLDDEPDDEADKANNDTQDVDLGALKPIFEEHIANQDSKEVAQFLEDNPDFKPYAKKVEKMMKHDSRRNVPINELFYAVAGTDLMKIGAKRAKEADNEAKNTQSGGSGSSREGMKPMDWSKATKEELEAEKMRVRQQSR